MTRGVPVEWSGCYASAGWCWVVQAWANSLGVRSPVGAVGSVLVLVDAPVLDEHLGFEEVVEMPAVEELVA